MSSEESEGKDEDGEETQKRYNLWQQKHVNYSLYEQIPLNVLYSEIYRGHFAIPISELSDFQVKLSTEIQKKPQTNVSWKEV